MAQTGINAVYSMRLQKLSALKEQVVPDAMTMNNKETTHVTGTNWMFRSVTGGKNIPSMVLLTVMAETGRKLWR